MPARLYDLRSTWALPNGTAPVWDAIADPRLDWSTWWPGCTAARPVERSWEAGPSREEQLLASTATFAFRASLGYTLTVSFHATRVVRLQEVAFDAAGDLTGTGRVGLSPRADGGTDVAVAWRVRPTRRWMAALSRIAAPLFVHAHDDLMRRGEAGLRRHLAASAGSAGTGD